MSEPYLGEIRIFAGNFAPNGWALCQGQILSIASNSALFSLLGTTYGGDGRTTFALPDLQGRAAVHQGQGPGLPSVNQGEETGTSSVTLTSDQLPSHSHTLLASDTPATTSSPAGAFLAQAKDMDQGLAVSAFGTGSANATLQSASLVEETGASPQPIGVVQPSLALNFIMALQGTYPARP